MNPNPKPSIAPSMFKKYAPRSMKIDSKMLPANVLIAIALKFSNPEIIPF